MHTVNIFASALLLSVASCALCAELSVAITAVNSKGISAAIGAITVSESQFGLVFTPALKGLTPGLHGFHVHENPSCAAGLKDGAPAAAIGAGAHYDPSLSKKHGTPWGDGHLGDLPPLFVDPNGNATQAVLAPRLKLSDLSGRSLMLHAGADNHADMPQPLGGGGPRVACGVILAIKK
jgi:superoxide dismutase, Cu-Zn family